MEPKIALITGANRGIGLQTAKNLAQAGIEVHLLGRNQLALQSAAEEINQIAPGKVAGIWVADLSIQKEIDKVCQKLMESLPRLDILLNNAGAVFASFGLTSDGIERTFATNHVSYFQLSQKLLPLLEKSKQGRIINVSSDSHFQGKIHFESIHENKGYFIMKAYEQSKLANVLFTFALARRLKDTTITVNALHPGRVRTEIGVQYQPWHVALFWKIFTSITSISIEEGAKTSTFLALEESVSNVTGKYFDACKETKPSKLALKIELQEKLWKVTESILGKRGEN